MSAGRTKILIVDDEPNIVEVIRLYLEHMGFEPLVLYSGKDVLPTLERERPDLAVLDVMLPDTDGFQLTSRIRALPGAMGQLPILMLTAKGEAIDKLRGFNLGVDDYIVKPFDPNELVARIKAVLRRVQTGRQEQGGGSDPCSRGVLEFPDLVLDLEQYRAVAAGVRVELTPKELELLYCIASKPGRVFTREELLVQVWNFDFAGGTRTVDAHVKNIRKKLGASSRWAIETLWGIGYSFEVKL